MADAVCELDQTESANNNPRGKPAIASDCLAMQRVIKADCLKKTCKPAERAQLARAYVELEKLKRITRGQPANVSQTVRAEPTTKTKPRQTGIVLEYPDPKQIE